MLGQRLPPPSAPEPGVPVAESETVTRRVDLPRRAEDSASGDYRERAQSARHSGARPWRVADRAATVISRYTRRPDRASSEDPADVMATLQLPAVPDRYRLIGRSRECDVVLRDPSVSRRHALLRPWRGGWELIDLGSTNGTTVNGARVLEPQTVQPGDVVTLGALALRVRRG